MSNEPGNVPSHHPSSLDAENARVRACGLARLLTYGMLDALEIDSEDTAAMIEAAIATLRQEFGLSEQEIHPRQVMTRN